MPPKTLMTAAAAFQALYGTALLFLPERVSHLFLAGGAPEAFFAQQLGTALLGFAALNWIARASLLGGIYGRAVVVGNLTFFTANALLLLGRALETPSAGFLWGNLVIVAALASGFALLLFQRAEP